MAPELNDANAGSLSLAKPKARWRRLARSVLGGALAFTLLFPVIYAITIPEQIGTAGTLPNVPDGTYRVYVVDWGYHTAIVAPQPAGWMLGPPGEERALLLEYAWGDRRFYMESNFWPHSVYATLILPTESVVYLDGRDSAPSFAGARAVYSRIVDGTTLRVLLGELEREFRHAGDGSRVPPYSSHSGFAGRFFPAYGRYLWTRNCNWWTVERLRAVGLARSGAGVVFSGQVRGRLLGFGLGPQRSAITHN